MKKTKFDTNKIISLLLIVLMSLGLFFRIVGISKNLSYWNDESNVAFWARSISEHGAPITSTGHSAGTYQYLLNLITAFSFSLFGFTEFFGRLPSVIMGTLLIYVGYTVAKRISGQKVALITSFLLSFSQIELAWSTQLRPYIWLQLFTLLVIYYLYEFVRAPWRSLDKNLLFSLLFSLTASLFHGTGLIDFALVGLVFAYKAFIHKKYLFLGTLPLLGMVILGLMFSSLSGGINALKSVLFSFYFSPLHYRIFLTHNYLWLMAGALLGFISLLRKNKTLAVILGGSALFIFCLAIFKINPRYVRYSLPAFPLMYLLFAEGVVFVVDRITKKKIYSWLLIAFIFVLLGFTDKLVYWPKYYYSINADVRENPIVDYKLAFSKIEELLKDKKDSLIIDAWNDRVPWYLPGQEYIMANYSTQEATDPIFGEKLVGTLDGIKKEISRHQSGVVLVEDWQSFMSEDIKEYVRGNLKHEFTIQDLPYNENDHWGISVYSWGI